MTPKWERALEAPELEGELLMDAVLKPNRSLSQKAFRLMMIAVIAINVAVASFFVAQGAFPVAGFLGLDVLALWLAFRWNYKQARAEERVRVAPGQVHVLRKSARGAEENWVLNPAWARVERDERGVLIASSGVRLRVASFLSPDERADFAKALDLALWKAKKAPL